MPTLENYGAVVAETTTTIRNWLSSIPFSRHVTARTPDRARHGVTGYSINLFLYNDELVMHTEDVSTRAHSSAIADLHYLVSVHPDDSYEDAYPGSHSVYGSIRGAVERHPVLTMPVADEVVRVQLRSTPLTLEQLSALWLATGMPIQSSLGVTASFIMDAERLPLAGAVSDVLALPPGAVSVFTGIDLAAKLAAATSIAEQSNSELIRVPLHRLISEHMKTTERNIARLMQKAASGTSVLMIEDADAVFAQHSGRGVRGGVRSHLRFRNIQPGWVLHQLSRAPGHVIISIDGEPGAQLARWSGVEVRFPPNKT